MYFYSVSIYESSVKLYSGIKIELLFGRDLGKCSIGLPKCFKQKNRLSLRYELNLMLAYPSYMKNKALHSESAIRKNSAK